MTKSEIKKALSLLGDRVERNQTIGVYGGGLCLTVFWVDGGQRLFNSLHEVESWLDGKQAPSVRKNITQPADWWQAFEAQATEAGLTLSEWIGLQCVEGLDRSAKDGLSKRAGAHRPKKGEAD
jgi:hypothetical protein